MTPARLSAAASSRRTPAKSRLLFRSLSRAWLIESRVGPAAEAAFLRAVNLGEIERVDLTDGDWDRVVELLETYGDMSLGTVDASVVAVAERLGVSIIATLHQRDFRVVCPRHVNAFELLP